MYRKREKNSKWWGKRMIDTKYIYKANIERWFHLVQHYSITVFIFSYELSGLAHTQLPAPPAFTPFCFLPPSAGSALGPARRTCLLARVLLPPKKSVGRILAVFKVIFKNIYLKTGVKQF